MWNIDQHSLFSCGWPCDDSTLYTVIHRLHSLETNRAGPISRQILVLSEHYFIHIERQRNLKYKYYIYIYVYCTVRAWIMPNLCPFHHGAMAWPAVCDYGISWPYSIIF